MSVSFVDSSATKKLFYLEKKQQLSSFAEVV
jgi:hypothetical protein